MSLKEGKATDLRVRRTRMLIERAFMELLRERDFQAITVQDIADRAMVNRATFYDHFTDKYALFEHTTREMFRQTLETRLSADGIYSLDRIQLLIVTICDFVVQIDEHCRHTNPQGLPSFDEQIMELVSELLVKWFEEKNTENHASSPALVANVASWAIYGAARHWRLQKPRESVEDFAAQVAQMITAVIE